MTQDQRRQALLRLLLAEASGHDSADLPSSPEAQAHLLRGLMNLRPPGPLPEGYAEIQDAYLGALRDQRGVVDAMALPATADGLVLWRGDITRLQVDAIVNAANAGLTGCYTPNHACIDNCIHSYAGLQLRNACAQHIADQGHDEAVGKAMVTQAYNLPANAVIHTVGPKVEGSLQAAHKQALAASYEACLAAASNRGFRSLAFPCIATGLFGFPAYPAAEIALATTRAFLQTPSSLSRIIFNVFTDEDEAIYRELMGGM